MNEPQTTCHLLLRPEGSRPTRDSEAFRQDLTTRYALWTLCSHDVARTGLLTVRVPNDRLQGLVNDPAVWRVLQVVGPAGHGLTDRDAVAHRDGTDPTGEWTVSAWDQVLTLLGEEQQSRPLLNRLDVVRPAAGSTSPAGLEARLIALWMVLDVLKGTLNPVGRQRWFVRPRTDLGGRTPLAQLRSGWQPGRPAYSRVLTLALSDAAFAGT